MTPEQSKASSNDFGVPGIAPYSENGMTPEEFEEKATHTNVEESDRPGSDSTPSKIDRLVDHQVTDAHLSAG